MRYALLTGALLWAGCADAPPGYTLMTTRQAVTLEVPGEFATLRAAVDAAAPEDTIVLAPGTYQGVPLLKPLTLRGAGAEETIVEGAPPRPSKSTPIANARAWRTFKCFETTVMGVSSRAERSTSSNPFKPWRHLLSVTSRRSSFLSVTPTNEPSSAPIRSCSPFCARAVLSSRVGP